MNGPTRAEIKARATEILPLLEEFERLIWERYGTHSRDAKRLREQSEFLAERLPR
jgi:hypothetical protein